MQYLLFITFVLSIGCTPDLKKIKSDELPMEQREFSYLNQNFTKKTYDAIRMNSPKSNIFFSGTSIFYALMMAYEGASENTALEMKNLLGLSNKNHWPIIKETIQSINIETSVNISLANKVWIESSYKTLESFNKVLQETYLAPIALTDFFGAPEESRLKINKWVFDQTKEKIKDLIPSGVITSLTKLVLANAIYFKGAWKYEFDKKRTHESYFFNNGIDKTPVKMMTIKEKFKYFEDQNLQIIEIPYKGDKYALQIVLPTKKDGLKLVESLNLKELKENMRYLDVNIFLPKFKLEETLKLNSILKALGMNDAFDAKNANFSGISEKNDLFISSVIHKAFFEINEEGSEAAAASAIMIESKSLGGPTQKPKNLRVDRPFIFSIINQENDVPLFTGRVVKL